MSTESAKKDKDIEAWYSETTVLGETQVWFIMADMKSEESWISIDAECAMEVRN